VIRESAVICEYLEEVFPAPPLSPTDALGRAELRLWTRKPDDGLHRACATCANAITFRHQWLAKSKDEIEALLRATPDPVRRDWRREMIEHGTASKLFRNAVLFFDVLFDEMEDTLIGRPWLLGEDFTLADIALFPFINRIAEVQLHPLWERSRPRITDWFARFQTRESYQTAFGNYPYDDFIAQMKENGAREWPKAEAALKTR
jgi:glutathione S-transferase